MVLALAIACQTDKGNVLDYDKMEEVLYDIHRVHFAYKDGEETRENGAMQYALFLKVLEKHDVKQAQWDSSMVYYCKNADELQKIYDRLTLRLEREAELIGAATGGDSGDSTNIWRDEPYIMLTSYKPYTTRQWTIPADTLLKPGEKVTMRFTGLFLQPDVNMRAEFLLAMRLQNDSVVVNHQVMTRTGIYNLSVTDSDAKGIKEVKGMFMMHRNKYESGDVPVAQILCLKDIVLLHEPQQSRQNQQERTAPSLRLSTDSLSLPEARHKDSLQLQPHHHQ